MMIVTLKAMTSAKAGWMARNLLEISHPTNEVVMAVLIARRDQRTGPASVGTVIVIAGSNGISLREVW